MSICYFSSWIMERLVVIGVIILQLTCTLFESHFCSGSIWFGRTVRIILLSTTWLSSFGPLTFLIVAITWDQFAIWIHFYSSRKCGLFAANRRCNRISLLKRMIRLYSNLIRSSHTLFLLILNLIILVGSFVFLLFAYLAWLTCSQSLVTGSLLQLVVIDTTVWSPFNHAFF